MSGREFRKTAQVCAVFFLVTFCASSKRDNEHGILPRHYQNSPSRKHKSTMEDKVIAMKPYKPKHETVKQHVNTYSSMKSSESQDKRDFVQKEYADVSFSKRQNIFEEYYGNQSFSLFGDKENGTAPSLEDTDIDDINGGKARKGVPQNELGDLKRVDESDKSVNEVITSILDDDIGLEKAMSDEKDYKPTHNHSEGNEDFDVIIDESREENQEGSFNVQTSVTPDVADETLHKGMTEAERLNEPLHISEGKSTSISSGKGVSHPWSVQLDSINMNNSDYSQNCDQGNSSCSHGNKENIEPLSDDVDSSGIRNQNHPIFYNNKGTAKNPNDPTAYNKFGNGEVNNPILNTNDSILFDKEKSKVNNTSAATTFTGGISSPKILHINNDDKITISPNSSLTENTNLDIHGDEMGSDNNQYLSDKINLPREKNFSSIIKSTHLLNKLRVENDTKNAAGNEEEVLGSGSEENKAKNPSEIKNQTVKANSTSLNNEGSLNGLNSGSTTTIDSNRVNNNNGSLIAESIEYNTNKNKSIIGNVQSEKTTSSSNFMKQHPNAFQILMEYFRNETLLQKKLRNRLNALRKTKVEENAVKKSFESVHEMEVPTKRPLSLREFVTDFLKFATEHITSNSKPREDLKLKTSKQGFSLSKLKATKKRKPENNIPKSPGKLSRRQNSIKVPKQDLSTRKSDVSFLTDFENVTEVAKEINDNITKIFQDAMNSNSKAINDTIKAIPNSALGLAEERIGKIITEHEIPQNEVVYVNSNALSKGVTGAAESNAKSVGTTEPVGNNAIPKEGTTFIGSNAIMGTTDSAESNVQSAEPKTSAESNVIRNVATGPLNTISKGETAFNERNSSSKQGYYGIEQTNPSVAALYDFIHIKNSMDSKTMLYKKELKSLEVSLSQDFFGFWIYHYRSFEEMSIKPEQLRAGIANLGSTDRLERVIKKALRGELVNLLIVGGSISAGGGLERDRHDLHGIYYKAFVEWWKNTVTPITTSNLNLNVVAIGGTDSEYFAYCIKNYIQDQPDLVIWELAANDYRRYVGRGMDPAKPLEQLTRVLLTLPSQPALIFVNFFRGDYYKTTLGQDCPDSEDEGGHLIAEYYKITSLTWRNIICSQMKPDILAPGNGAKREYTPLTLKTLFSSDGYHPSLLGHAQCATLLTSYIRSVFEEVVSREISRLDEGRADDNNGPLLKSDLPRPIYNDPMFPNPHCWTLLTPNFQREIENQLPNMRIVEANGFEFTNITHWPVRMDRLRCLKALNAGAILKIKFDILQRAGETSSAERDIAIISHNSFSGSARVWLDDDQYNALDIEEPTGQRRTQATIIKRVMVPGNHEITIKSTAPGFCVSALAVL